MWLLELLRGGVKVLWAWNALPKERISVAIAIIGPEGARRVTVNLDTRFICQLVAAVIIRLGHDLKPRRGGF